MASPATSSEDRSDLAFARIEAWWDEWIAALNSLSENELDIPGVCGKWSARDLMAHVDGWDRHGLLVAKRSAAGLPLDDPELRGTNRRSRERYDGLSVPESKALMEQTHAEMVQGLRVLGEIEPKWIAEDTYRHYPDHVGHVLDWRSQRADERDAGLTIEQIVAEIDRAWAVWRSTLDDIPESLRDERGVCGSWSVKDLLGHIATWDQRSLGYALRRQQGNVIDSGVDWQTINDESFARNRDRSFVDLYAEMVETHQALMAALPGIANLEAGWIADGTYEHYPQHVAQVRAWKRWRR
jgi:hypothetical protein